MQRVVDVGTFSGRVTYRGLCSAKFHSCLHICVIMLLLCAFDTYYVLGIFFSAGQPVVTADSCRGHGCFSLQARDEFSASLYSLWP